MSRVVIAECDFCGARADEAAGHISLRGLANGVVGMPLQDGEAEYDCCAACALLVARVLSTVKEARSTGGLVFMEARSKTMPDEELS